MLGNELSDQRLADQQRLGVMLAVGAIVLVALLTLFGWIRGRRRHLGSRRRRAEVLALANSMIPPEVRRDRPCARITDLSNGAERSLWRRQGGMLLLAMCLPVVGLLSMVSDDVRDVLSWVGEHPTQTTMVAAPVGMLFVLSQMRLAARSIGDRSELLGLRVVESPSIGVGVRGGAVKPIAVGGVVREGVRHGRRVQVSTDGDGLSAITRTLVEASSPDGRGSAHDGRWVECPQAWLSIDPGPGHVTVTTDAGGVLVQRSVSVTSSTADVIEAELSDLRVAEAIADRIPRSAGGA